MLHANPFLSQHSLTVALLIGLSCHSAIAASPTPQAAKGQAASQAQLAQSYGKLPLSFEANRGQTDPRVKFLSQGQGYSLFLTNQAAVLSLTKPAVSGMSRFLRSSASMPAAKAPPADRLESPPPKSDRSDSFSGTVKFHTVSDIVPSADP